MCMFINVCKCFIICEIIFSLCLKKLITFIEIKKKKKYLS